MPEPVYDLSDPNDVVSRVRLLINDVASPWVFQDVEIQVFLDLEGGVLKRAAALAIESNADNELLASKVITTKDVQTDGAKIQAALLARAKLLRGQADQEETDAEVDEGSFTLVNPVRRRCRPPELTEWPSC